MKKTLALATLVAGVAVAGTSFASSAPVMMTGITNPWYVGIGANYNAAFTNKLVVIDTVRNLNYTYKLSSRGWGGNLFVGYLVNKYFGTELGVSYLGTNKFKEYNNVTTTVNGIAKLKNQWNVHMVANAYLPVTDWFTPYAFAGVGYMNYQLTNNNGASSVTTVTVNHYYSGFGLVYGAGLQFNIQQFGIRAYYTRQDEEHNISNGSRTVNSDASDYISLDVLYRFGM